MKKILILALGFWLWWPVVVSGQDGEVCEGFGNIITVRGAGNIGVALTAYLNPLFRSPSGDEIWLCFQSSDWIGIGEINTPLSLHNTSGLPVVISGLNIRGSEALGTQTLLSISGANPVIIRDSSFSDCVNCLSIRGNSFRVENVAVECGGREAGGIGIKLLGEDHQILGPGTEVSNCGTGILLGDTTVAANNIQVQQVSAHHNGIAISVVNGHGNYFRQNSIFSNDSNADAAFLREEGILLASGANSGVALNEVLYFTEEDFEGVYGAVLYPKEEEEYQCDSLTEGWSEPGELVLRVSRPEGGAEIALTEANGIGKQQGKDYFLISECTSDEVAEETYLRCPIAVDYARVNKQAVAVFHHPLLGSSSYSLPFVLNDPCKERGGFGVLSAAELEAPGVTESGPAQESVFSAPDNTAHTSDDHTSNEDSKEDGNEMAANPIGGGSASGATGGNAVVAGGLGGSGAPGGVGGCGGSINPAKPAFPGLLLVLLLSLALRFYSRKSL